MKPKVNISVENLPDSLRGQIQGVESARDNESLALFTDNKDVRVSVDNTMYQDLRSYSNTFNHYDLWGRFVRSGHKKVLLEDAPKRTIITRKISEKVDGIQYTGEIKITPAVVSTRRNGEDVEYLVWPSDREEKVERALIRLASKGKIVKINFKSGIQYAVVFSMNELAQELKSVGQSMPFPQIKEALEALQGSKLSFKYSANDTKNTDIDDSFYESNMNFLSSLHFSGKKGQGGNIKCVACLNAFVHNMIDNLEYKGYYFNRAQEQKRGLSRWMMLRLYHLWRYAAPGKTHHFRLLSIMEKYGSIYSTDNLSENKLKALRRDMTTTMKDLITNGAISDYSISNVKDDKTGKIIDYTYELHPTNEFCEEILTLNKQNKRIEIQGGKRILEPTLTIDEDNIDQFVV
ncbi:replication protein A [Pseudoalteromonas sp. NBT06-2]|uniref:replication protein A n=1 Tax=Pseudoalteromonas sp. NBT06-2 TaxID=2025950 RepID=UPI000BA519D2|nr:replication protein A [Pseudoalteromonas sp. NBT06-2]PAJ73886.1 replication protein A [Pseudoalteromonas sp. NBT06-2]